MRVLLVNPYIYDFTAYDLWLRPLGLLYIAAILKKYSDAEIYWLDTLDRFPAPQSEGFNKSFDETFSKDSTAAHKLGKGARESGRGKYHQERVEKPAIYNSVPRYYSRFGMPFDGFREKLEQFPDVDMIFVTTLMTYWIEGVKVTVDSLKKRFPNAKIVIGGIIPSLVPPAQLKHLLPADYYVEGYGETQVLNLIEANGGKTLPHPDLEDIANLPYPAVELLNNRHSLPLMTSRGCPFRCTYCASDILNKSFVQRSAQSILDEITYMVETHDTKHFAIFDDALLINKSKRFLKVFEKVSLELGRDVGFHTPNGLHAGEIDRETAGIFYKSGFKTLCLSFESTSKDILTKSSDKVTVKQMVNAVKNLEAAGYARSDIGVYLLFGLPGQRLEDIEAALDFAADLGVTPHLSNFSPVPGTTDFIDLQKKGIISTPVNLYETNKIYFLYTKSGFSHDEIKHIKIKQQRGKEV
ncbi:MAG: radical SAM protein [bacterium]|nr:radical SAM protein [bacterium]